MKQIKFEFVELFVLKFQAQVLFKKPYSGVLGNTFSLIQIGDFYEAAQRFIRAIKWCFSK